MIKYQILMLSILYNCQIIYSQKNYNVDSTFIVNYFQESKLSSNKKQIIQTLKDYHVKVRSYESLASAWHSKFYDTHKLPEAFFNNSAYSFFENRHIVPYLIKIDSTSDYFIAEVSYVDISIKKGTFNDIYFNYEFYFQKDFDNKFRIVPKFELINKLKICIKNKEFNLINNVKFTNEQMMELIDYGDSLSSFFEIDTINFKAYYTNTFKEQYQNYGFINYPAELLYSNIKDMGFSELTNKLYFSTPQIRVSKHELTHLYLFEKFRFNTNQVLKEGLPTFLIGTWEPLGNLISKIKIDLKKHPEYNFNDLMYFEHIEALTPASNYLYGIGALICKLTYEKNGKKGLFDLLGSGSSDVELYNAIEKQLGVKRENLNEFLKAELNKY